MTRRVVPFAIFVASIAASTAVAAARPTTFDLVCKGQMTDADGVAQPFSDRLSVDMRAQRWCDRQVGCPYVFPIRAQHGDRLQLLAVKTPYNEAAFDVDLKTGDFTRSTRIPDRPRSPTAAKGVCTPTAFTPLP